MEDNFRHKGLRKQLVDELRSKDITDERILDAFMVIPRHYFLDTSFVQQAYSDIAFQIGAGQTISQPYTVAFQTQLLDVQKGMKVLEIGTGSGFQTSVLCELGAKVFSIERQRELFLKAKPLIEKLRYNPKLKYGDGFEGWEVYAPFDRILITCGAPHIPEKLVEQLKIGGKMVIPLGAGNTQEMILLTKDSNGEVSRRSYGKFRFVPMLKDTAK
ncbi:protein-L-isoaspartate(D-aspartate) O-methyltransferase [Paracrocinitomix mangrovi]|uniref:protein-L-isoaspartate(D-aspartate) O-methyltransferase n=1 Tax=Paracrocinitomix mangrovi TaxID=2862509 RepID=UPI001C8D0FBF|nr:protein-L-isoaspartate(D-aspartate) O-methyltransferase [Paracrocinitomix mangrovi]UKN03838.1 protein-L-isoaspartate(D-aspartate) O-methyltransferase [Paracrocinitomix mangrovi]